MRGKAKQRVSLILVVTMVLGTVLTGNTVFATGESSDEQDRIKINISKDSEQTVEQNVAQTIHVIAQGQCSQSVCLNVYLKNEDGSAATDIDAVNLLTSDQLTDKNTQKTIDETLKDSVTLNNGTKVSPTAEWKNDKDDNGTVTSKYLQITMPADATAINFDMQLQYRTDEASYTKKVLVEAKAFEEEQDITEAAKRADESKENEATVVWEGQAVSQSESEAADEDADGTNESQVMAASADTGVTIYFAAPKEWTDNRYTIKLNGKLNEDLWTNPSVEMQNTGKEYNGKKVYKAETTTPNGGYYILQFQAYAGSKWIKEILAINKWTPTSDINNHIYEDGQGWKDDFTPFNPNDHTYFAGKNILFYNKGTEDLSGGVTAVFYEKDGSGTLKTVKRIEMTTSTGNKKFTVTIPNEACSYIRFIRTSDEKTLGDSYSNFYGQGKGETDVTENFVYNDSKYCYNYISSADDSSWGTAGAVTVYYDATLSKLSYKYTDGAINDGQGIPYPGTTNVYYYATNGKDIICKQMTATDNANYPDVYKADLPDGYNKVRFAAYNVQNEEPSQYGDATDMVTIPGGLMNPCYYGDSSDDVIYKGGNRGGYWDEAYTVRDPEKEAEQHNSKDVVDIKESGLTRNASTLYVNSTFYDYYTDYELNGKNRDDYADDQTSSHRTYVTFRQFNQALSDYYRTNQVTIPIYTGHFQPNMDGWGSPFSKIAYTLDLYGYDSNNQNGFMSTNNSTLDNTGNSQDHTYAAAQGLVADSLKNKELMTKTENGGEVLQPHFNEQFLTGENSKHTALAKVYKNVSFPFTKVKVDDNGNKSDSGVEYWYFDSADTTLAMRKDKASQDYYLENINNEREWSMNVNSASKTDGVANKYGFFPFNETSASCKASKYNYGFGAKLEFKFRLTDDGTVVGTDGKKDPIKFNFSGDDDVWVYVDGNLALDVGGAHGKVTGQIDFSGSDKKKKAIVSKTKVSQGSLIEGSNTESNFEIKGSNSDEHTLTMFYMERGMWESNMKVSFNFPDENEFAVEKKVDTTDVNTDLFPTPLFEDANVFPFTIQNQATHYGTKEAQSSDAKQPKIYNDSFSEEKLSSASPQNTFEFVDSKDVQSQVVHWKEKRDDAEGKYVNQRFGIIQPASGDTFDASDTNAFLQFKMYYDYPDIPGLTSTYLELEDDDGNTIGGYLSGKTYGNSSLVQKKWNTIQVDLSKLQGDKKFNYSKIKNIKFNYNFARDIYLDDFIFIPSVVAAAKTGFVTQQQDIPDYGSATSGTLEYPEGAQYTLSKNDGSSKLYRIGSDGMFALADGETATFSDQFRRGSYIAVSEDVNSSVFDTTWTLYENGQAVSTMGTGATVENEGSIPSVKNVTSDTIRDGRKEVYKSGSNGNVEISNSGYPSTGYAKNQDGKTNNENTIVFRSYVAPDNQTTMTKLKATFVNKVKTGKIEIRKETAEGSNTLKGDYTFRVEFSNVAELSLESKKIVKEYKIKAGKSVTIDGIPAGTDYRISEIESTDGSTLESVIVKNNNTFDAGYDPVTKVVAGKVIASSDMKGKGIANQDTSTDATIITFKNTLKPTINLNLTKEWKNVNNITLPKSIKIQLQRSKDKGTTWEKVKYDGKNETITLSQGYDGKWSYSFKDLDQYVNYRAEQKVPYIYRVVEVSGDDGSETVIESGGYLNDKYKVAYSENVDCSEITKGTSESKTKSFTITNTYSPKTNIKITKQDASTKEPLNGAEFKLEKMKKDTSTGKLVVDNSFKARTVTTEGKDASSNPLGIAEFKDLTDGTYRLTETKAAENHSLLKDPVIIVINRSDKCLIDNEVCEVVDNTISITISNQARFDLPATGGYGRYIVILGGIALAGGGLFMYRLQKRRKEGNIS